MYRFRSRRGKPQIQWKSTYANSGVVKPGQADAGSGTTPTIMRGGYVAISDNADPMNVVVYRKAVKLKRGQRRVVCQVPVFEPGAGATENSLMTNGSSLYVENNYGYQDPFGPNSGALTTAGFARVDVNRNGRGCRKVWTNTDGARAHGGPEAVNAHRPDLHVHARSRPSAAPAAVLLDGDRRAHGSDGLQGLRGQRARLQQQLRRAGPRGRPARRTWE